MTNPPQEDEPNGAARRQQMDPWPHPGRPKGEGKTDERNTRGWLSKRKGAVIRLNEDLPVLDAAKWIASQVMDRRRLPAKQTTAVGAEKTELLHEITAMTP